MGDTIQTKLRNLRDALKALPLSLPQPKNSSYSFLLDAEDLDDIGYEGALNRALENSLGLRANGLKLRERGPGIISLVPVFEEAFSKCPGSAILEKWVDDLVDVARSASTTAEVRQ